MDLKKQILAYFTFTVTGIAAASLLSLISAPARAQQAAVTIDNDAIGGVVRGPVGPEAGVWVIAETTELPTKFAKIVVTDDQGRFVIPDLPPKVNYEVWVRGYGLVDSPKLRAKPGQQLDLTAVPAPNEAAAAHYYPAIYWFTLLKIPPAKDFGGSTDIPKDITQDIWRQRIDNVDCVGCHQLGQEATRTIPAAFGEFKSGEEAWMRRVASGQTGEWMVNRLAGQLGGVPFKISVIGPIGWPRVNYPRPSRNGRPASSATLSSPPGSGPRRSTCARSDFLGPSPSNRQRLRSAVRFERNTRPTTCRSSIRNAQGDILQNAGRRSERAGVVWTSAPSQCHRQADWRFRLLGRGKNLEVKKANNHNGMFDERGRVWFAAAVRGIENS